MALPPSAELVVAKPEDAERLASLSLVAEA
jgi:hypothetical protein